MMILPMPVIKEPYAVEEPTTDLRSRLWETAQTDHCAFVDLVQAIDWPTRSPEEILKAIDLALSTEMASLAMELAQQAGKLFPNHFKCQQAARVIAPPKMIGTYPPQGKGLDESAEYISKHASEFRGQWVAAREGRLVGVAPTLGELDALIKEEDDQHSVLITRVL